VNRRDVLRTLLAGVAVTVLQPVPALAQVSSVAGGFGAAEWMRIPAIGVDSHISDVGVVDGYYDVPWFDIGHHADSHDPGDVGNSIFNGHVVTINAGEVFRRLDELRSGDAVYVYTPDHRVDWVITNVYSVAQDDNAFLEDTDQPTITLYTCTGQFNPVERSYAERLVVTGVMVRASPRTDV
jgi:LPXTG-site transpeptidase (sortase) family protein